MGSPEVVCIGLATMDTIVSLPAWPHADGRVMAHALLRAGGGPAATAAVAMARLGRRVAMVGAVGDDDTGTAVRSELEREGVDVAGLRVMPGRTSESVILLDRSQATRSILHHPGVALEGPIAVPHADMVHVDHAGYRLADSVEPRRLSVDAGNPTDGLSLSGLGIYAPTADSLRRRFAGLATGMAVRRALDEGALRVAVTLGAGGALAADRSGAWRAPGVPVNVVSTLGAGDVFHGALVALLLEGRPLADALKGANMAAALSCRTLDGRGAIPTRGELEAALLSAPPLEPVVLEEMA